MPRFAPAFVVVVNVDELGDVASPYGPNNIDNMLFQDFKCNHSSNAAWIKTYLGQGCVRNVTCRNFKSSDVDQSIYVTPCIYSGQGVRHVASAHRGYYLVEYPGDESVQCCCG